MLVIHAPISLLLFRPGFQGDGFGAQSLNSQAPGSGGAAERLRATRASAAGRRAGQQVGTKRVAETQRWPLGNERATASCTVGGIVPHARHVLPALCSCIFREKQGCRGKYSQVTPLGAQVGLR